MIQTLTVTGVTVTVPVRNVAAAREWYARLLGHGPELEPAPDVVEFELFGEVWLQLLESHANAGTAILRIGVSDLEAQREVVASAGVDVGDIEQVEDVIKFCDFRDPDGNLFSLVEVLAG
jgi:catechol 2,3-dioxygenase-like lactoylglutathione lyase family enzyme